MSPLEKIGLFSSISLLCFFLYILVIAPIMDLYEVYKYNKQLHRLSQLEIDLIYLADKIYMTSNKTFTLEGILKNKNALKEIHDEVMKSNEILREEIESKIGWITSASTPGEFSERYYDSINKIRELKTKLGLT